MPTGPIQVSVVVRSANPQGKGVLIKALQLKLREAFPQIKVNIPKAFEDLAPLTFNAQQITVDITEAIDAPGMGSVASLPVAEVNDAIAKQKIEISQLLQLFLTQYQSEHFLNAKIEYPHDPYVTAIEVLPQGGERNLFRVTCRNGEVPSEHFSWVASDVDIAMDIFRHYSTTPLDAPVTWVWVKTMDVPRPTPNYLQYSTPLGQVDFVQHASEMLEGDYYYAVSNQRYAEAIAGSEPAISGNFTNAADYFLKTASLL